MSHGSLLLQPLVLTEDEAEAVLGGLEMQIAESAVQHFIHHTQKTAEYEVFLNQLYDKIKDAPR